MYIDNTDYKMKSWNNNFISIENRVHDIYIVTSYRCRYRPLVS